MSNLENTMEISFKSEEMRKRFLEQNFPAQMKLDDVVQLLDAAAEIATCAIWLHNKLGCSLVTSQNLLNEMIDLRISEIKTAQNLKQIQPQ